MPQRRLPAAKGVDPARSGPLRTLQVKLPTLPLPLAMQGELRQHEERGSLPTLLRRQRHLNLVQQWLWYAVSPDQIPTGAAASHQGRCAARQ